MKKVLKKIILIILILTISISCCCYIVFQKHYNDKRKLVQKDEESYMGKYMTFESEVIKDKPDRIIFKKENAKNEFYIFNKNDKDYDHLLEVTLDRMYYLAAQDFNMWSFTPYTIENISNSNENFIIFDYNENFEDKNYLYDTDFNRDIFIRFSKDTRLYRLLDFLTYKNKKYTSEALKNIIQKDDFIMQNQIISGYKYMHPSLYSD